MHWIKNTHGETMRNNETLQTDSSEKISNKMKQREMQ